MNKILSNLLFQYIMHFENPDYPYVIAQISALKPKMTQKSGAAYSSD